MEVPKITWNIFWALLHKKWRNYTQLTFKLIKRICKQVFISTYIFLSRMWIHAVNHTRNWAVRCLLQRSCEKSWWACIHLTVYIVNKVLPLIAFKKKATRSNRFTKLRLRRYSTNHVSLLDYGIRAYVEIDFSKIWGNDVADYMFVTCWRWQFEDKSCIRMTSSLMLVTFSMLECNIWSGVEPHNLGCKTSKVKSYKSVAV